MFGGNRYSLRPAVALALSLLLHLGLGASFVGRLPRRFPEPPLEVAIFNGGGAAAPAAGDAGRAARSAPGEAQAATQRRRARRDPPLAARAAKRVALPAERRPPPAATPSVDSEGESPLRQASVEAASAADPPGELASSPSPGPRSRALDGRSEAGSPRASVADPQAGGPGAAGQSGFSVSGDGAGGSGRSYASIWKWTQRYLSDLRRAYDRELQGHPRLRGVLVVRYEILASGAVGEVAVVSTELRAPRLERGVLRQIRAWRYPPEPSGSVVVTWPFAFEPAS